MSAPPGAFAASHPVDVARLNAVYNAHRASFWAAVAADYGPGANPLVLEQAWRGTPANNAGAGGGGGGGGLGGHGNVGIAARTPITPVGSPDDQLYSAGVHHGHHGGGHGKPDKTRISAILGIDANPRSPSEREMVRRLEEERVGMVGVGVGVGV
jgi:hypothetical protein